MYVCMYVFIYLFIYIIVLYLLESSFEIHHNITKDTK